MRAFFNPAGVAVAGASRSGEKLGNVAIANMRRFGYAGRIVPIHPQADSIMGYPAYPDLVSLPEPVDVAIGVIPRELIPGFVQECGRAGVKRVIVSAAGFADAGGEGAALQEKVRELAAGSGIRMMGPNSVGTISTESGFVTSLLSLEKLERGGLSIVAQTGLFAAGLARWISSTQHFGLAKVACLGNKADVDELDILRHYRDDPQTRLIGVYTEGVKDGRSFLSLLREITPSKPVLVLKGGRTETGGRMAAGHTGSMAGSPEIYSGALAQAGAIEVDSIQELFDFAKALQYCPEPRGPNLGVISVTGGGCVMAADACHRRGLGLPPLGKKTLEEAGEVTPPWAPLTNPADIWSAVETKGIGKAYRGITRAMARQEDIHMLMPVFTLVPESDFDVASTYAEIREEFPEKPVLACAVGGSEEEYRDWFASLERLGIPAYDSVERGVAAAAALCRYAAGRKER
jgi:acetyltransferase